MKEDDGESRGGAPMSKLKSTNRFARDAPGANLLPRASRGPLIGTRSRFSRTSSARLRVINTRRDAWSRSKPRLKLTLPFFELLPARPERAFSLSREVLNKQARILLSRKCPCVDCANFYNVSKLSCGYCCYLTTAHISVNILCLRIIDIVLHKPSFVRIT